jgi:signal transduction histidine kinase/DNA-binding response OmpR family regulator
MPTPDPPTNPRPAARDTEDAPSRAAPERGPSARAAVKHILVVEDCPIESELLRFTLESQGFAVEVAADGRQGLDRFLAANFDLVLTDVVMPGLTGFELCRAIKDHPTRGRVPVVLLTSLGEPIDILRGIQCGADNFLTKPYQPEALIGRLEYIFTNQARRAQGGMRAGVEVSFLRQTFEITAEKEQILDLLLTTCEDIVRSNRKLRASQDALAAAKEDLESRVRARTAELAQANALLRQEVEVRRRAEVALAREREYFKAVLENAQDGIVACDAHGAITFSNRSAEEFFGPLEPPPPPGEWARRYGLFGPDGKAPLPETDVPMFRALGGERFRDVELVIAPAGREPRTLSASGGPILSAGGERLGAVVVMHDITERNRLEQQLRHSQKMEAVGRLAGGVAHDFNNLVTIINGYSEVLQYEMGPSGSAEELLGEIRKAGDRAAGLTRQLLAFSRQQVTAPRVLDLNAVVADVSKMLERIIGEDVTLTHEAAADLGPVRADPGQVEQVLLNLAVNARDAMPQGGRLVIRTANVEPAAGDARLPELRRGRYVLLSVSDTGCGMDAATKARAFEPFFTTKETGKGTGLGLATVYGIVKQSGGHVEVFSEPGRGTTFTVYLPRVDPAPPASAEPTPGRSPFGTETLLLAEDEEAVRTLAGCVLRMSGYTVLEAADGAEALRVAGRHAGPIHLLVTDVVMPGMGGRALADRLTAARPETRVLYLSGYTADEVVRHGVREAEVAFLQKPFKVDALILKVREALDRGEAAATPSGSRPGPGRPKSHI